MSTGQKHETHVRLHQRFILINLDHNPGCDQPACPLFTPDPWPSLWARVKRVFGGK